MDPKSNAKLSKTYCCKETMLGIFDDDNFFLLWFTNERRLVLFPTGTIVRVKDPHHRESPTRREQDLKLRRT